MSAPKGNNESCFPESLDVFRDEVKLYKSFKNKHIHTTLELQKVKHFTRRNEFKTK